MQRRLFRRRWLGKITQIVKSQTRECLGSGPTAVGGSGRSNVGRKEDGLQILHNSGGPLLGHFPVAGGSSGGESRLRFVEGIEGSPVELSLWPDTTWAGRMEGPKLIAFLHFSASLLQSATSEFFSNDGGDEI